MIKVWGSERRKIGTQAYFALTATHLCFHKNISCFNKTYTYQPRTYTYQPHIPITHIHTNHTHIPTTHTHTNHAHIHTNNSHIPSRTQIYHTHIPLFFSYIVVYLTCERKWALANASLRVASAYACYSYLHSCHCMKNKYDWTNPRIGISKPFFSHVVCVRGWYVLCASTEIKADTYDYGRVVYTKETSRKRRYGCV